MKRLIAMVLTVFNVLIYGTDFNSFSSIDELIAYEKLAILNTSQTDLELLAEAYLDLGETYFIARDYTSSVSHLLYGREIAEQCVEGKSHLMLRSAFALALAYSNLDMEEEFLFAAGLMKQAIDHLFPSDCSCSKKSGLDYVKQLVQSPFLKKNAQQSVAIEGPEHIPMLECVERAHGTAKTCRALAKLAKKPGATFILDTLIDGLERKAVQCCYSGGMWKGCLQPLVDKWNRWNMEYNMFGIPPDPAWD